MVDCVRGREIRGRRKEDADIAGGITGRIESSRNQFNVYVSVHKSVSLCLCVRVFLLLA